MRNSLLFLISTILFWSCVSKVIPSKSSKTEPPITEYSEDLSMFRPKYDIVEKETNSISNKTDEPENKKNNETTIKGNQNQEVEKVLEAIKEYNKKNSEGKGYRIQVFSGNNKQEFESAKMFLLRNFSQLEIYESYSQPTYKIKTGDFLNYNEAEEYAKQLKSRFGTVRIISDKINYKKAVSIK